MNVKTFLFRKENHDSAPEQMKLLVYERQKNERDNWFRGGSSPGLNAHCGEWFFPGYTEPNISFGWHLCSDLRENSAGGGWMFFKC